MTKLYDCPRCGGSGKLDAFHHVECGICFLCKGTGKVDFLPNTEDLMDQVCDQIHSFYQITGEVRTVYTFYIWRENTGKQYQGTGHLLIQKYVNNILEVIPVEYHQPLDEIRILYKAVRNLDGAVPAEDMNEQDEMNFYLPLALADEREHHAFVEAFGITPEKWAAASL